MNKKVLLVDDEPNVLAGYQRVLRKKYELFTADSALEGLLILNRENPLAVVVSDYRMPQMDGVEFLSRVRELAPNTVRIMLTAQADFAAAIAAVNEGWIFRFISKPCSTNLLAEHIDEAIEHYRIIHAEKELLDRTLKGAIGVLIDILSIVNPMAFNRSGYIRNLARDLAIRLEVSNVWEVELSALLSQIGCMTVPNEIMNKKYRGLSLSIEEETIYNSHPLTAKNLLQKIPRLEGIAEAINYQMKNYDGSGIPDDNVRGSKIPLIARILKVACDYDRLLVADITSSKALNILHNYKGYYDPMVLRALESEIMKVDRGMIVRNVEINDMTPGMRLAEHIYDVNNTILIAKTHEITEALIYHLRNYAQITRLQEPIKILEPVKNSF